MTETCSRIYKIRNVCMQWFYVLRAPLHPKLNCAV